MLQSAQESIMAKWISVNEAAHLTGYHAEYIRELIRLKHIKARKIVIVWQIDQASLMAYAQRADGSGDRRRGAKRRN